MPTRVIGPLCVAAVLVAGLAGCGGSASSAPSTSSAASASASGSASGSASPSPSASGSPTAAASADPKLAALRDRVQGADTGTFTQTDQRVTGQTVSSASGSYSLQGESLAGAVTIPDTTSKQIARAKLRLVGGKAYLQVNQWKQPSRSCWLASTPQQLSQSYALDVSSGSTPLAVALLDEFTVKGTSGPGTYQGQLSLTAALPLLSGTIKQQLEQAKPQGTTPAFLVDDGKTVTITIPGYGLIPELSAALGVPDTQLTSIKDDRYVATVTPGSGGGAAAVKAPAKDKQMTDKQLAANTCG